MTHKTKHVHLDLQAIINFIEDKTGYTVEELKGRGKKGNIIYARHIYTFLAKKHTMHSWASIASLLGRNHATSIHSNKVVNNVIGAKNKEGQYYTNVENAFNISNILGSEELIRISGRPRCAPRNYQESLSRKDTAIARMYLEYTSLQSITEKVMNSVDGGIEASLISSLAKSKGIVNCLKMNS